MSKNEYMIPNSDSEIDSILGDTDRVLNKAVAWAQENAKRLATSVEDTQIGERLVHLYVNTFMQLVE